MGCMKDVAIVQKTYDLILWYVPILNRLPRDQKFALGNRMVAGLYDLLEELLFAQYATCKLARLEALNPLLNLLRYQTRLLLDFHLIEATRYEYAAKLLNNIGRDLGGWIKQRKQQETP